VRDAEKGTQIQAWNIREGHSLAPNRSRKGQSDSQEKVEGVE